MKCPHHNETLILHKSNGFICRACRVCRGVFVPLDELNLKGVADSIRSKAEGQAGPPSPVDSKPMEVVIHKGVEIDYCVASRSIWFDSGELEKIVRLSPKATPIREARSRKQRANESDAVGDVIYAAGEAIITFLSFLD